MTDAGNAPSRPPCATLDGGTYTYTAAFDIALRLTSLTVQDGGTTLFNSSRR